MLRAASLLLLATGAAALPAKGSKEKSWVARALQSQGVDSTSSVVYEVSTTTGANGNPKTTETLTVIPNHGSTQKVTAHPKDGASGYAFGNPFAWMFGGLFHPQPTQPTALSSKKRPSVLGETKLYAASSSKHERRDLPWWSMRTESGYSTGSL